MNKRLGICIPTYRRPDQLRLCLESVIASCSRHAVQIVVADDSTDSTNASVRQWLETTYPFARWISNPTNLGIDGNILHATDLCECDYAWLLGEDDRMVTHAVETVLAALEALSDEPPFVFVNYASVDSDIRTQLKARALPIAADTRLPWQEFAACSSWAMGFIGACVINRRAWAAVRSDAYTGTYFAHAGLILETIRGKDVPAIADSLVLNRCGEPRLFTWTSSFFEVLLGWERMAASLPGEYSPELRRRCVAAFERAHGVGTLKFLLYARADFAYNPAMFHTYIRPRHRAAGFLAAAWLAARVPPSWIRLGRSLLRRIRRATLPAVKGLP